MTLILSYVALQMIFNFSLRMNLDSEPKSPKKQQVEQQHTGQLKYQSPAVSIQSPTKAAFNHQQFGIYADASLEAQSQLGENIKLSIDSNESRGSAFMKYVVYHICGSDKNGPIDVYRRFNQFYKMRLALIKRFPGCFIPSIPVKQISIVDDEISNKRQRYLNDFVRKMTKLPHLYNSQEFQALLRSTEKDLSSTFEKWPNPTSSDIINKYKDNFSHLSGKQIDTSIRASIHEFTSLIQRTRAYMDKFKGQIKALAMKRDKFDRNLAPIFSKFLPSFESQCLVECVTNQQDLIYANSSEAKFLQHEKIVTETLKKNPYWFFYDLIKHESRDGQAFLECAKAIQEYQNKKYELQVKISENNKTVTQITLGKKSNSEQKYKLEVENETLKKQKESVQCLTDIIIALVAFVEMDRFKKEKSLFYINILKKLGGYQINQVQNMHEVWYDWKKKAQKSLNKIQNK